MTEFDSIFEWHRRVFLDGTAKSEQEALQNPIESFRFMVLDFERVDETTARILVRFAQIPKFVAPYVKSTDTDGPSCSGWRHQQGWWSLETFRTGVGGT